MYIFWVLLIGFYVYKIKKLMDFGFFDFISLDKCCFYCNEELCLNQCFIDDFYLEVLLIIGSEEVLWIGGDGEVIEYLLKMCQFLQDNLLVVIQGCGELFNQYIDELVEQIVYFYQNILKVLLEYLLGIVEFCMVLVWQNFEQVCLLFKDKVDL